MRFTQRTLLLILGIITAQLAIAQGPGGGQGRQGGSRFNPGEMAKMEKQMILDSIPSLSDDQKLILDQVFKDMETSSKKLMEEMRSSNNREGMREKFQAIRKSKDEALKDLFNEEQNARYEELKKNRRKNRGQRGGRRQRQQPAN